MIADLRRRLGLAMGALAAMTLPALADICKTQQFEGVRYAVCTVTGDQQDRLRLWLDDADGHPLGEFRAVRQRLAPGEVLDFAMNAGMYHSDLSPVGLFRSDEAERGQVVTAGGGGNFGLLPNGVFCVGAKAPFQVIESRRFARVQPQCRLATQSGPLLLIDGELHPRFLPDSDSRYIRNGVGVSRDMATAWFAISDRAVTFHQFARFFRDGLGARNALYFDGSISRLYAPTLGRADWGRRMGPIIGYVSTP
ncbi:MAG TPA: phosphodiester glycosidase family protein [Paracoccus solventivorans]|uniref:phosphodiester glycosidase family protein n=1 Tax=Paracoccus solventivorans TaxID=53463 RepID=UPI002D158C39|nr:phosphodiester glycosidase family protein [Paracoccus solventivorans]HMM09663.1 phosphodiester glycosidase family protein [Paracoccus solventivorans]